MRWSRLLDFTPVPPIGFRPDAGLSTKGKKPGTIPVVKIFFHGAARTVTGSMHLVETNGLRILLDCGLYQGRRQEAAERNRVFPFDPGAIDAVVLSHAHIDHSGNLPGLVKAGFRGPIHATPATADLCAVMLPDSARIQEKDAEFLRRKKRQAVEPLYTAEDAAAALRQFVAAPKSHPFRIGDRVEVTFHEAGHMLGSAGVLLEARENGRAVRLGFSGDVGHEGDPLLPSPRPLPDPEVLILESTYGDRSHPPPASRKEEFLDVLQRTARRGGKLIVPAFSVGRTQLLVYTLNELFNEKRLPPVPVFVDSPLSVNVTDVFRRHPEELDPAVHAQLDRAGDDDPFGFSRLTYIRDVQTSKALNDRPGPFLTISASGMCEAGRILHHLKNTLGDARNTVLIVGFQAPHTLGRRLLEGSAVVRVLGEDLARRAEVAAQHGFSAHADQAGLAAYARGCNAGGSVRRVFLVHGEVGPATTLADILAHDGLPRPHIPDRGESAEL